MDIFLKNSSGAADRCKMLPFPNEEELEKFIWRHPELLSDVFLLERQVRGGGKPGIPDIIGLGPDDEVCIVEIKNVRVDSSILAQVLDYAIWAERNPDSIKNMWLTCKHQPDDRSPTFDNYAVRVMVVAPSIDSSVLQHVSKVNLPIDLFEVNRYQIGSQEIVAVNKLELAATPRPRPVQGLGVYDRAYYEENHNKAPVVHFFEYIDATKDIVEQEGWPLELKFNKGYAVFKIGLSQAFGIHWHGSKSFGFFFKLTESEANEIGTPAMLRYNTDFKYADYRIQPGESKAVDYLELMRKSVGKLIGTATA